jgi:hypothetical protein
MSNTKQCFELCGRGMSERTRPPRQSAGKTSLPQQVDSDHYTDMGKFPTAIGTRTGVWYAKRDRLYIAAPPSGVLGARLLVFEAQTD